MSLATDLLKPQLTKLDKKYDFLLSEITSLNVNNPALQPNVISDDDNEFIKTLGIIQSTNTALHTLIGKIKRERKLSLSVDELSNILKPFNKGSLIKNTHNINRSHHDSQNIELLEQLESLILSYSVIVIYHIMINELLQSTIPLSDDLYYWDQTYSSNWRILLYSLQTLPIRSMDFLQNIIKDIKNKATATPNLESFEAPEFITRDYPQFINHYKNFQYYKHLLIDSIYHNIIANNIKGFYSLGVKNIVKKNPVDYVSIMIGAPISSIRQELKDHRNYVTKRQRTSAEKLGSLITNLPNLESLDRNKIHDELVYLGDDNENSDDDDVDDDFQLLFKILDEIVPDFQNEIKSSRNKSLKPSFLTRYWPSLLLTLLYGPSTVLTVISNKDKIMNFVKLNLIDTIKGFWQNWILKPINNILSTIRHDDSSEISIMSQNSLDSDLDSLKRMVIDYTIENSGQNYTVEQIESLRLEFDKLVSKGDLTPLMKNYENDIKQPLKNIISGKLTRALLIQLQKTKVDGAVAINGIDKLLKSQELVFGIVAASPSLFILIYILRALNSYLTRGYITRWSYERKLIISKNLNNIERLLNEEDNEYTKGMLLLETYSIRKNGYYVIPKNRRSEWRRDVGDLNKGDFTKRLNTVKRIYNVYGEYF